MSEICGLKVGDVIYDFANEEEMSARSAEEQYVIAFLMNHITNSGDPNDPDLPNVLYGEAELHNEHDGVEPCNPQAMHDFCVQLQAQGIGDEIYWKDKPASKAMSL